MWPQPSAGLLDWRNRFNFALADLDSQITAIPQHSSPLPSTRQRLTCLSQGLQTHQNELQDILAPLRVGETLARETHLALATRLPSHHGILSYTTHIFRDWSWGEEENQLVAGHLVDVLKPNLGERVRMLVLGAGAGRLAYDLHHKLPGNIDTVALDSNPFLCLVGQTLISGGSLSLTEFPHAPIDAEDVAISRILTAPPGDNTAPITYICADATRPPFAPGSFDVVVTPWLIDVIDMGLSPFVLKVGELLAEGGLWLNHGSVAFRGTNPLNRITANEIAELSEQAGFEICHQDNTQFPYLQSPASRNHRRENVYTQLAKKSAESHIRNKGTRRTHQHLPDWIVHANVPVPVSPEFQTQITTVRIHAFIMGLIDGKRDINAMAKVLEEQRLMPANQATQAIRGFLQKMYEEAVTASGHSQSSP